MAGRARGKETDCVTMVETGVMPFSFILAQLVSRRHSTTPMCVFVHFREDIANVMLLQKQMQFGELLLKSLGAVAATPKESKFPRFKVYCSSAAPPRQTHDLGTHT